jgi:hypothetical protein
MMRPRHTHAMFFALSMALAASAGAQNMSRWTLLSAEADGSMGLYAEQGSYARILDRGAPSLRLVVKLSSGASADEYQQIILTEDFCAKGFGPMDRYTLDGLTYLGAVAASRARPAKTPGAKRPSYDDVTAEALCAAYESSLPARAEREPASGSKTSKAGNTGATDDAKPTLIQKIKSVFN